ncbi:sensor histidine kinase [Porphyrobacter algicida]|uniref:histidine kinase n=1 Tax=Qipengyuania algicida TaxID=1836209 RepID=A0A845AI89_9SPHN|nr:HAMP domain-containing sensor histidine kinase [Qipengyuania algicida]MXP28545.1 sensor histidine kinase [Qipengyuania algicida]
MASIATHYLARGKIDAEGRLISADPPLVDLQFACGGKIGGVLAIPELRTLVDKARSYGLRLARRFSAIDGRDRISAWVEIVPQIGNNGKAEGCEIGVVNWHTEPIAIEDANDLERQRRDVYRLLSELTARLDARQNVVAVEVEAADLHQLKSAMVERPGKPWTDFVQFPELTHEQPMHWRLLDGAQCQIAGSERSWTAYLEPLGHPEPGSLGFVLHLLSDTPLDSAADTETDHPFDGELPSLGQDLAPVLRQPINRIIANAETIRSRLAGPIAPEYSEYAGDVATAGQHLLGLIDDLSDLEVVEADSFVTTPDSIDMGEAARQACAILGSRARERDITLVPPVVGEAQPARAEFRRVLQILINLVGNAVRYSPEGSQVWVRLDRIGTTALVTVADQGRGLDPEEQAKVFRKFERLGRSGDGGSGLGLYISRRLARAMGGDLTVESAPGRGARFTLSVPTGE